MDFLHKSPTDDVYFSEFLNDFHENQRLSSLIKKQLPCEKYAKHYAMYGVHEQSPKSLAVCDQLKTIFLKNVQNAEPIGPCQKVLAVHALSSEEQNVVSTLCTEILDIEDMNDDVVFDPLYGTFFEHISPCDTTLWVKYPALSPSHVHMRLVCIVDCDKYEPVRLISNNIMHCISKNCVCAIPASLHALSIMRHKKDILLLSIGLHMSYMNYIVCFMHYKDNNITACIRNEKIINARLRINTEYHDSPHLYHIALRDVEAFIPMRSTSLIAHKCTDQYKPCMLECYARALLCGHFPTSYPMHNCLHFKSIPMTLIDSYLGTFIEDIFARHHIPNKRFEIHIGVCLHGGCFLEGPLLRCQDSTRVLVIERMSSNKLYLNGFLHNVEQMSYYLLNTNDTFGFTAVMDDDYVVFMEIIGI